MQLRTAGRLTELPFRQIHLDYHTSELIPDLAAKFDPEEFADTLVHGHVNQVCCFARCHHGWLYYDSKSHPERIHPNLRRRNLLAEQVAACHRRGIRVPIYTTVMWDYQTYLAHPEWRCRDIDGNGMRPTGWLEADAPTGFYGYLCPSQPAYREFLKRHTEDIYACIPQVDGFFYDIVWSVPCVCDQCRASMLRQGMDPASAADRERHGLQVTDNFVRDFSEFVRHIDPHASLYFNGGSIGQDHHDTVPAFTQLEFDALPGQCGYLGLRKRGRFERNLGVDCVLMTGRFHQGWGDMHSYRNRAALEYECFQALSLNIKCLVGDQLHPCGRLDRAAYDTIGAVYAQVEAKEPWCRDATAVTDIGILAADERAAQGAVSMLVESAHQFDVLDFASDLTRYAVVILPDRVPTDAALAARLDAYVAGGGRLIASFESGLDTASGRFVPECLPATFTGDGPRYTDGQPARGRYLPRNAYADYILPTAELGAELPRQEHVMYARGVEVVAKPGAAVLAYTVQPYFARTATEFSSHLQAPSSGRQGYPAAVQAGNVIYFGHPIFDTYFELAPRWCKVLVLDALRRLLPEPRLTHNGPTTLEATVNAQAAAKRWVVHLLHYIPPARTSRVPAIEDVIPLHDVAVSVRTPQPVCSVRLVPDGATLPFTTRAGRVEFTVPRLNGHQMVELGFDG